MTHSLLKGVITRTFNDWILLYVLVKFLLTLPALMALKWRHAGQACITANRVYVQAGVYDSFASLIKEKTSKLKIGHGAEDGTTIGPLTTPRSIDKATNQVEDASLSGAVAHTSPVPGSGEDLRVRYGWMD